MGQVVRGASCLWGEMSWGKLSRGGCPWGKLSLGRVVHGASCLWGEMTVGQVVVGRVWMGRVVRGASFDGASGPGTVLVTTYDFNTHCKSIYLVRVTIAFYKKK
jgi:hypothetical protein